MADVNLPETNPEFSRKGPNIQATGLVFVIKMTQDRKKQ